MSHYRQKDGRFHIKDYEAAKTFASFLPAIAGPSGRPMWVFYTNIAQGLSSFGVGSKETPIIPFDSATLAYQNIALRGFRSFLKIDGRGFYPFFRHGERPRDMWTSASSFGVKERGKGYIYEITYNTVPNASYAALVREVKITNTTSSPHHYEGLDGLPTFLPLGLSNYCYKELVSLMAAYCEIHYAEQNAPFVKFKTSTSDEAEVKENRSGNAFFGLDEEGILLPSFVDPSLIFGSDPSLERAVKWEEYGYASFVAQKGQTENKLPSAFVAYERDIGPGETYTFYEVYGAFDDIESFKKARAELTLARLRGLGMENEKLIEDVVSPAFSKTAYPGFDGFLKQSYLDNGLRGGFPVLLDPKDKGSVYYLYSRKHGDMERDYNNFDIPSAPYSSGPGNFRDVNQNRRNDLFFNPYVGDYNVRLFFELIQADGQNPLTVKPPLLKKKRGVPLSFLKDVSEDLRKEVTSLLDKGCSPSALYVALRKDAKDEKEREFLWSKCIRASESVFEASFGEGYWVDHWTYNVDLLENYSSVYPDREESLLFDKPLRYFRSPAYVLPRDEKYCLLPDDRIRQYGALDLKALAEDAKKEGYDLKKGGFLLDTSGKEIKVSLASKIIALCAVKYSSLDPEQMGIEMEGDKPGWNDAMNGLPGLFGSGLSETVELVRLIKYAKEHLSPYKDRPISFLEEQGAFFKEIADATDSFLKGDLSRFAYWDKMATSREKLRENLKNSAKGAYVDVSIAKIEEYLDKAIGLLEDGLKRAKDLGGGILPSYLIHEVTSYEETGKKSHLGFKTVKALSFKTMTIPPFLEASARALKLGRDILDEKDLAAIKRSDLYDRKFGIYKTCASLDGAPFEIGRVHAFTKGWLERECDFLHMSYKYLLGLLKGGFVKEFYEEMKTNMTFNMDPEVYGRNPAEASSFIVPSCNPDPSKHGQGFFARLSGANAEALNIYILLFAGEKIFSYERGNLQFHLKPLLSDRFFDERGEVSFLLFGKTKILYRKKEAVDLSAGAYRLTYVVQGRSYKTIEGRLAEEIRRGNVKRILVEITK